MQNVEAVKVVVRVRPLNENEKNKNCQNIIEVKAQNSLLINNSLKQVEKQFTFDAVYDQNSVQSIVYQETAQPLVEACLKGYNATVFAYGQTGCGKTYSMVGDKSPNATPESKGIIPRAFESIFESIDFEDQGKQYLVRCSYCEIYMEQINDLLSTNQNNKLKLKENKDKVVYVKGLTTQIVKSLNDIDKALQFGDKYRVTGETSMNEKSSRSHAIFTVYIEVAEMIEGKQKITAGKLNLVDLAGSERQSKTNATGVRLEEGQKINLSLSALGNVISALVDGKSTHIPYRDSKLTRLLQDSLGGNTKTVMIAVVSPADYNYEESLSTLRYASRAKFIQNKPRINEDPKDTLIKQYQQEIEMLRQLLTQQNLGSGQDNILDQMQNSQQEISEKFGFGDMEDDSGNEIDDLKKEKERFMNSLKMKDKLIKTEQEEKQRLQAILQELEQKMCTGGQSLDEEQRQKAKEKREMIKQYKKQKKKQKKMLEEQKKKEEEKLFLKQKFQDGQQEVEANRALIKELRKKLKNTMGEVDDLQSEHNQQNTDILDQIRSQKRDLDFYKKLSYIIFSAENIQQVRDRSVMNTEENK